MGKGGVETFLKNLIYEQVKKHDIVLITLTNNNTYNIEDFKSIKGNMSFIEIPYKKIYDLRIIFKLRSIIKKIKPDIIHTHLFPGQFITPIILLGFNLKFITTEHGISLRRIKYPLFHYLEWFSFSRYNKIVCVSSAVNIKLKEEYPSLSYKILTINNGIDIQRVYNTNIVKKSELSNKFNDSNIIICMVGRLDVGKDFETLIKAMKLLPTCFKLLIVGDGPKRKNLEKMVIDLELEDRVDFFGFKKDIYYVFKSIDIFVLSSEREGLPITLLEAMSAKKPCIGSNVDGIKNILVDELLFEYKNEHELADKILFVNNSYELYSEKCYLIVQQYDFSKMFESYESLYKEVLME